MNVFTLTVSTPDGDAFSGEAYALNVRGTEGDLAVMAGHVPFATGVKAGSCRIDLPDGTSLDGSVSEGILTVSKEGVTLLTGTAQWEK
jgi:F-type H+-transporting ATPase subunit epsilon